MNIFVIIAIVSWALGVSWLDVTEKHVVRYLVNVYAIAVFDTF